MSRYLKPHAWLVALTAVTYLATAAHWVLGGDCGEFATLFTEGGVAHPPGYPLYTLILRALSWLPASSPAEGAAQATALIGTAAIYLLYRAGRCWGASEIAATAGAALFAFSSQMWRLSTQAEVFALNALIAAGILALSGPFCRVKPAQRLGWLGLLAGLGIANHLSIVLLMPIGLWAVLRMVRRREVRPTAFGLALLLFAVGLLPYAYTVSIARAPGDRFVWGAATDIAGLWHHLLRVDYGTTQLAVGNAPAQPLPHLLLLGGHLLGDPFWLPGLLAILAMAVLLFRKEPVPGLPAREETIALLTTLLLCGPMFVSRFNIVPTAIGRQVVERFHLLPMLLVALLAGLGVEYLLQRWQPRQAVALWALAVLGLAAGLVSWPHVEAQHRGTVERYLKDTLRTAPKDAVILGTGDHRFYGFLYAQRALGMRPDVTYVDPKMLLYPWYRQRASRELGLQVATPEHRNVDTAHLAEQILAAKRPLLLADVFSPAIVQRYATYPIGTLIRVLPPGETPPDPLQLEQLNLDLTQQFDRKHGPAAREDGWARELQSNYGRPWFALGEAFDAARQPERARLNRKRAEALVAIESK